jgi:hypothetical protein
VIASRRSYRQRRWGRTRDFFPPRRALALALGSALPISASAAGSDFTIGVLPDTQYYAQLFPSIFHAQTQWLSANQSALNRVYVAHLGDCVQSGNNGGDPVEWLVADGAMSRLEDAVSAPFPDGIPYGIAVGNHDQSPAGSTAPGSTLGYNQWFGESRFLGRPYYGGHYGSDNDNHVDFFSVYGMDFMVIYLEYDTSVAVGPLAWADALLSAHPNRRAIVVSHFLITTGANYGPQGQAIYDALKDHPNLFLMLAGHRSGEAQRVDVFQGNTIRTLLSDYQTRDEGGQGWLRTMEFSPANDLVRVKTYSPWLDQFETDANSQFTFPYDMNEPLCTSDAECDDGLACNGSETCNFTLGCQAGTPVEIDDGIACTIDSCEELSQTVLHLPDPGACDDGDACTAEACDALTGCSHTPIPDCPRSVPALPVAWLGLAALSLTAAGLARRQRDLSR